MPTINTTGYVLLSQGSHSDYQNTAFRVLKPFSFNDANAAFTAQWAPDSRWNERPRPDQFVAWLLAQGFIEDATEIQELHIGDYEFNDNGMDADLAVTVFQPRAD